MYSVRGLSTWFVALFNFATRIKSIITSFEFPDMGCPQGSDAEFLNYDIFSDLKCSVGVSK